MAAHFTDQPLFSAREIAANLGVTERTVRRWIQAGDLPATKERGVFRVSMDDARTRFASSRAAKAANRGELLGRYLETKERLAQVETELVKERARADRLQAILYAPLEEGAVA